MPESFLTTSAAPPLLAPATTRRDSPPERTYPLIVGFGPMYVISIAPANNASIADGPALNDFHSILTFGPIALSHAPFALPTIACGCVMFGNAPTRTGTALCPNANPERKTAS